MGQSLTYDHCKAPAEPLGPGWVDLSLLYSAAAKAADAGLIAPLASLKRTRTFLYRGTADKVYLDGAVNKTADFFSSYAANPHSQVAFVANIPSGHCTPTVDPAVPRSSCGSGAGGPPAVQNCGFDGAKAALAHLYAPAALMPPATPGCNAACAAHVVAFDQRALEPPGVAPTWLGPVGYALVPPACAAGGACRLHVALHGCGMSVNARAMNLSYVLHAGFSSWGLANDIVVIFPQGGNDTTAPTGQMRSGCFDSYGHTGEDYAYRAGPQMATVRNIIAAVAGW